MDHSIFKAAVQVHSQEDCDIAREICERYELPMWKDVDFAFDYEGYEEHDAIYLKYQSKEQTSDDERIGFFVVDDEDDDDIYDYNIVSIQEFEALANDYNPQYKSVDDILSKMKELNNLLNNK